MWVAFTIVLVVACVAIQLFWSRRFGRVQADNLHLRSELHLLKDERAHDAAQSRLHQFAILNSVVEGVLVLDARGRIQTVNRSLERLFHLKRDVRGLTLIEALGSHELLAVAERLEAEERVQEATLTLGSGAEARFLEVNAARFGTVRHERAGIVMVFHDLTRLARLENMRKEFVANVSHELRTPLTLIKGCIETLIDGAKDDPEVALRFLRTIERHTERLTFLIDDLLTLSQLESGKTTLEKQNLPLRPMVERVLEELARPAEDKGISFQNDVPEELEIYADLDRIQQVLYNLIQNAVKYSHKGGRIGISAGVDGGMMKVCVADNGTGIPAEARERIFERFYRVDRARSREAGGTGLGLAIVKHIIQAHNGKVWAESELERGSQFYFVLPLEKAAGE